MAETLEALAELKAEGKVREIGCSDFSAEQLDEAAARGVSALRGALRVGPEPVQPAYKAP